LAQQEPKVEKPFKKVCKQCVSVWISGCPNVGMSGCLGLLMYFTLYDLFRNTLATFRHQRQKTRKPKKLCRLISLKIYEIKAHPGWRIKI